MKAQARVSFVHLNVTIRPTKKTHRGFFLSLILTQLNLQSSNETVPTNEDPFVLAKQATWRIYPINNFLQQFSSFDRPTKVFFLNKGVKRDRKGNIQDLLAFRVHAVDIKGAIILYYYLKSVFMDPRVPAEIDFEFSQIKVILEVPRYRLLFDSLLQQGFQPNKIEHGNTIAIPSRIYKKKTKFLLQKTQNGALLHFMLSNTVNFPNIKINYKPTNYIYTSKEFPNYMQFIQNVLSKNYEAKILSSIKTKILYQLRKAFEMLEEQGYELPNVSRQPDIRFDTF